MLAMCVELVVRGIYCISVFHDDLERKSLLAGVVLGNDARFTCPTTIPVHVACVRFDCAAWARVRTAALSPFFHASARAPASTPAPANGPTIQASPVKGMDVKIPLLMPLLREATALACSFRTERPTAAGRAADADGDP